MVKTEAVESQKMQEDTLEAYNQVLIENGLEHFIGQVNFKVQKGMLKVFPKTEYAREILGAAPYLEIHL